MSCESVESPAPPAVPRVVTTIQKAVYFASGVGVIEDVASHKQRFLMGHTDDITVMSINHQRNLVVTGQMGARSCLCVALPPVGTERRVRLCLSRLYCSRDLGRYQMIPDSCSLLLDVVGDGGSALAASLAVLVTTLPPATSGRSTPTP